MRVKEKLTYSNFNIFFIQSIVGSLSGEADLLDLETPML